MAILAASVVGQNCKSGLFGFNPARIYVGQNPQGADPSEFDFTVDYNPSQAVFVRNQAHLYLTRQTGAALGTRISTTRKMLYGKFTAKVAAIGRPGVITAMITMSPIGDEIDYEFVGARPNQVETNVFYKGIAEYNVHSSKVFVQNTTRIHTYTIDWTPERIQWLIDGRVVRRYQKNSKPSPMTPIGEKWFPQTPSQVQFSVWDAGSSESSGTRDWSGGPIPWGEDNSFKAVVHSFSVECYSDSRPNAPTPTNATNLSKETANATQHDLNSGRKLSFSSLQLWVFGSRLFARIDSATFWIPRL